MERVPRAHIGWAVLACAFVACNSHPMVRKTDPEVVVDTRDDGRPLDAATDSPSEDLPVDGMSDIADVGIEQPDATID